MCTSPVSDVESLFQVDGMRGIILKQENVEELRSARGHGVNSSGVGWVFLVVWVALLRRRYGLLLQFGPQNNPESRSIRERIPPCTISIG